MNARIGLGQATDNAYSRGTKSAKSSSFQTNPATADRIFLFRPGIMLNTSRLGASFMSMRFLQSTASGIDNLKMSEGPERRNLSPNIFQ